jgi:hypothetical protein
MSHFYIVFTEDEFQTLQNDFMEKYYLEFEDTEENKFCYTDIHREYVSLAKSAGLFQTIMPEKFYRFSISCACTRTVLLLI